MGLDFRCQCNHTNVITLASKQFGLYFGPTHQGENHERLFSKKQIGMTDEVRRGGNETDMQREGER